MFIFNLGQYHFLVQVTENISPSLIKFELNLVFQKLIKQTTSGILVDILIMNIVCMIK